MHLNEAPPLHKGSLASALSSFFNAALLAAALPTLVGLYLAVPGSPECVLVLLALYRFPLILPRVVVVLWMDNM